MSDQKPDAQKQDAKPEPKKAPAKPVKLETCPQCRRKFPEELILRNVSFTLPKASGGQTGTMDTCPLCVSEKERAGVNVGVVVTPEQRAAAEAHIHQVRTKRQEWIEEQARKARRGDQ